MVAPPPPPLPLPAPPPRRHSPPPPPPPLVKSTAPTESGHTPGRWSVHVGGWKAALAIGVLLSINGLILGILFARTNTANPVVLTDDTTQARATQVRQVDSMTAREQVLPASESDVKSNPPKDHSHELDSSNTSVVEPTSEPDVVISDDETRSLSSLIVPLVSAALGPREETTPIHQVDSEPIVSDQQAQPDFDKTPVNTAPTTCAIDKTGSHGMVAHDTALLWAKSPQQAGELAHQQQKLVFMIHISGNFSIPEFT